MLRLSTLICLAVLGFASLTPAPPARAAENGADTAAATADKGRFSLDRIHKELCRDIKLDRAQHRTLRQMRIDDEKKHDAVLKAHDKELEAYKKSDRAWKKASHDALDEAKRRIKTARKIGEAKGIAEAEAAYRKLLDTRPKLPAILERETFDPDQVIPTVKAVMRPDQMAEFEANVKALKRMREKARDGQ